MHFQFGLVGYPLEHSLSPKIHNAAFKACGLQGGYSLFPIHKDDKHGLKDLLTRVRSGEIHGLNVTIPHKQNIIEYMDELTPVANAISAVNTIYLREGKLVGDNTDASGFLSDLKRHIGNWELGAGKSVLILGAGGSARAVVYALADHGWIITITSRRLEQAQELAAQFKNAKTIELNFQTFQPSNVQLIVNTTPVGMAPNVDRSPLPGNLSLPSNAFVYDLVYNPGETKLVRDARTQGLSATTGLGMLIEQAALSFEIWTGCIPPRDVLFEAVRATRPD
ncbi:MAG: shikimate dehydrogenase [Anaerolineales bacterium]|nr:MAG: shikimate dehydrogenase [Anaerolineales bacterium]